jgi:tetratricopeptide (TPR) repeat protein
MTLEPPDSWYRDALAIPRPASPADLAKLSPAQFELFSLLVISSIYGKAGLDFKHTPFSHDGGRDADAQYIFGVGLDEALQLQFRIWLEVKQRKTTHVGKKDVGSHIVDASIVQAHTIIFVTNTKFSKNLAGWLTTFSKRTGVQHKLIDGKQLIQYAVTHLGADSAETGSPTEIADDRAAAVSADCWFSLSPSDVRSKVAPHSVIARSGRPLYLNVDLTVPRNHKSFKGRVVVRSNHLGPSDCHPHTHASSEERLFAPGDVVTTVYNVWPASRRVWSARDFEVLLGSSESSRIEAKFLNEFELEYLSLPDVPLKNQQAMFSALLDEVSTWKSTQASRLALFVAPPGAGKSHLLSKLRRKLASDRVQEIYVDCETVRDDRALFRQVVQDLLPLPAATLDADLRDAIAHWCRAIGLGPDAAGAVVEDLCGTDDHAAHLAPRHRAELLAMLLGEQFSTTPQVVFVEDLHKATPSLLTLLWQLIGALRNSGRGRVLFVLCTRPYATDASEVRVEWLARLETLTQLDAATLFRLEQPSHRGAEQFLSTAVEGLESYHIETIVRAVGTSPYELREALLFLLVNGALEIRDGASQPLSVASAPRLADVIASQKLQQVTKERLKILFGNQPRWLHQFLLAGAAYGRVFATDTIAAAVGIEDENALDEAIATCGRWSVVTQSTEQRDWLEFDHDLVRDAVLLIATPRQRMRVGGALYEQLKNVESEALLARIAYQGGFPRKALEHATQAALESRHSERLDDVVELNQLAIQTLDPELGRLSIPNPTSEYGFRIDSAIRFATPIRVPGMRPADVDRAVLKLLIENLDCLAAIGSGSSGLSASTLSEAYMIAVRCGDKNAEARLAALEGRLLFERDEVERAVELHERAAALFAKIGVGRHRARAENLIRLAICHRTLGEYERSFEELRRAMHACVRADWIVLNKIRNNIGAVFLKRDWQKARHHWGKELAHARRHRLESRAAHALLGLGFLDLFEGELEEGATKTRQAMEIVDRLRLDNQSVRAALNMSVYYVEIAEYDEALVWLQEGEKTALRHQIGRRLWRIVANMATVHELRGERRLSIMRDRQVVNLLQAPAERLVDPVTVPRRMYGRQVLALVNVLLRRSNGIGAEESLPPLPPEAFAYAAIVNRERRGQLPDLMDKYCVKLPVGRRFLLTE